MIFLWTSDMAVDHGMVDEDHKQLIAIANRVFEFTRPNREAEEIKQVIRELYDYAKYHFAREEGLMSRLNYPARKEHARKHEVIIQDMNHHLTSAHHMGEILGNFKELVNTWVIRHIMEEDLKLAAYISSQKHGLD